MSKVQIVLIVLLAVALSFFATPAYVSAYDLWNLQSENPNWTPDSGQGQADSGGISNFTTQDIMYDLGERFCIKNLKLYFYANNDYPAINDNVYAVFLVLYDQYGTPIADHEFPYRANSQGAGGYQSPEWNFDTYVQVYSIGIELFQDGVGQYFYWDKLAITYEPLCSVELTRPLAISDEHAQWGMFDLNAFTLDGIIIQQGNPYVVSAFSNTDKANVHAVASGTVTNKTLINSNTAGRAAIPQSIAIDAMLVFNLELLDAWQIEVVTEAGETYYYSLTSPNVDIGDQVAEGCILGKTIELLRMSNYELSSISLSGGLSLWPPSVSISGSGSWNIVSLLTGLGVTFVEKYIANTPIDFVNDLIKQPNDLLCKKDLLADCVNTDPDLDTGEGWQTNGQAQWSMSMVVLDYNLYLIQSGLYLDPAKNYRVYYLINSTTENLGVMSFTSDGLTNLEGEMIAYNFDVQPYTGVLDYITIKGTATSIEFKSISSDQWLQINSVCIVPEDSVSIAPGNCFFPNPGFDLDGYGWGASPGVTFGDSTAYLYDDDNISQASILLNANDPENPHYKLTISTRLLMTNAYTGQAGKEIQLSYTFGSYTETKAIGSADIVKRYDGSLETEYLYKLEYEITLTQALTEAFTITVNVVDADNYLQGARLDVICLTTTTGNFPGYPGTGPYKPPFHEACQLIPPPLDDGSIGAWTYYQYNNLKKFFDCDLMKLLNSWHRETADAIRTSRYFMRWMVVYQQTAVDWLWQVVPWLNGHFRNMAVGQVTYIEGNQQLGFWDVIALFFDKVLTPITGIVTTLTDLISQAVSFGFDIMRLIIVIIIKIMAWALASLLNSVGLAADLASQAQAGAVQAQAEPWLTLPNCIAYPKGHGICIALWTMNNTVWAGWGVILTAVVLGLGSIELILYLINKNADTLNKVSERL